MFGPFKPTSSLSVGLLWKIPWRLSAPRKLRHRRRLRRVDNIITVLDTALQRQHALSQSAPSSSLPTSSSSSSASPSSSSSSPPNPDHQTTPQSQHLLSSSPSPPSPASLLRSGRGPKRGSLLPPYPAETDQGLTGTIRTTNDAARENGTIKALERWKADMPSEQEMVARDKYTMFARYERGYRKGVHKLPKWTRVSQRLNPPGF
ncbi:mitochondrial ribosomal protein L31-domain-containing protein [Elsinoe ampelina]|uniref:Mitochondrial ribosomal protein L31-domain-containing protein n=1 Tax=Elsinoe ampelina TaxID=302913 RepID=A0A6A6GFB4_9PEZI|nr:mitochondrial ribosomal protein L31-domain-containing protein [Elsinoe ampelina]